MKIKSLLLFVSFIIFVGCKNNSENSSKNVKNKGQHLVLEMLNKVGDHDSLLAKKDVVYTYTYQTPNGKKDISTEKYIFRNELSLGLYKTHERTMSDLKGVIEQGYDGSEFWLKHNDTLLTDEKLLKRVAFNRPTNYYWFTMFQKLMDPGVIYEYIGEVTKDGVELDIVKISFETKPNKPTDIYQLYINKKTKLVDKFLFTVADFGVMDTPFLMELKYESVDGMKIPTKRKYKKSTWNADINKEDWIHITWSNIKFNNGLTVADFKK